MCIALDPVPCDRCLIPPPCPLHQRVKQASVREGNQFKEYARQQAQQREDDIRLLKVRACRRGVAGTRPSNHHSQPRPSSWPPQYGWHRAFCFVCARCVVHCRSSTPRCRRCTRPGSPPWRQSLPRQNNGRESGGVWGWRGMGWGLPRPALRCATSAQSSLPLPCFLIFSTVAHPLHPH